jgi:glycogen debranching enzyme
VAYPVACLPQAWAAGSVFMMLQACLGLTVDGEAETVTIVDPRLPIGIDRLWVDGLKVGEQMVALAFERHGERITVTSGARPGVVTVRGPDR